jgi:hypothetical protein
MRSTTNQINTFQIFEAVVSSLVQHLTRILSHVELSTVVYLVTGVPVIGRHNLLEPDSPPQITEFQFFNMVKHVLAEARSLFRPVHIWGL